MRVGGGDTGGDKFGFRHVKIELVSSFDVSNFLEHCHKLRKIVEFSEASFCSEAFAFRRQLNGCDCFAEVGRPAVEKAQTLFSQSVGLQIALHCVQLAHTVRDRRASCVNDTTPTAIYFVQVLAFLVHISGFLRVGRRDAGYVLHFGVGKEIFVVVSLINIKPIDTEFFKSNGVVGTVIL